MTKFIIYTNDEAGDYHVFNAINDEETEKIYYEAEKTRTIMYSNGQSFFKRHVAYIALVEICQDYDFILKSPRNGPVKS